MVTFLLLADEAIVYVEADIGNPDRSYNHRLILVGKGVLQSGFILVCSWNFIVLIIEILEDNVTIHHQFRINNRIKRTCMLGKTIKHTFVISPVV